MTEIRLSVSIQRQQLSLWQGQQLLRQYPVSTAANGPGQLDGSLCTPLGEHRIRLKIGEGCAVNQVFIARRPTGEIYSEALAMRNPGRDWILSRILWLSGCQPGHNRGGQIDTLRRHIYIHGCPETEPMGIPRSHGCVRMRNDDVIDLFEQVRVGTQVLIEA